MRRGAITGLTIATLTGLLTLTAAAGERKGKVVFHAGSGTRYRIVTLPAKDGAKQALTQGLGKDGNPSFTPLTSRRRPS